MKAITRGERREMRRAVKRAERQARREEFEREDEARRLLVGSTRRRYALLITMVLLLGSVLSGGTSYLGLGWMSERAGGRDPVDAMATLGLAMFVAVWPFILWSATLGAGGVVRWVRAPLVALLMVLVSIFCLGISTPSSMLAMTKGPMVLAQMQDEIDEVAAVGDQLALVNIRLSGVPAEIEALQLAAQAQFDGEVNGLTGTRAPGFGAVSAAWLDVATQLDAIGSGLEASLAEVQPLIARIEPQLERAIQIAEGHGDLVERELAFYAVLRELAGTFREIRLAALPDRVRAAIDVLEHVIPQEMVDNPAINDAQRGMLAAARAQYIARAAALREIMPALDEDALMRRPVRLQVQELVLAHYSAFIGWLILAITMDLSPIVAAVFYITMNERERRRSRGAATAGLPGSAALKRARTLSRNPETMKVEV